MPVMTPSIPPNNSDKESQNTTTVAAAATEVNTNPANTRANAPVIIWTARIPFDAFTLPDGRGGVALVMERWSM
jgi:hypothetical protein